MMRYRRNRAGGAEGGASNPGVPMQQGVSSLQQQQQYKQPSSNGWNAANGEPSSGQPAPWAVYQNAGKVPVSQTNQQQLAGSQIRKVILVFF
jgi:hypothetical protein